MDTQDAASVLELAKFAKDGAQVGDVDTKGGVKYTITNIDDQTGQISWDIDYSYYPLQQDIDLQKRILFHLVHFRL